MDNYKISFTSQFLEELDQICYYLKYFLHSPETANRFYLKVKQFISRLDLFPERYSKVPLKTNSKYHNLRKMPVDKYIILYEIDNATRTIYILHIFYGRQNDLYNL